MENSAGHRSSRRNRGIAPAEMGPASYNTYLNQFICTNMSCRAVLPVGSVFCQHCSCLICGRYDVNKDPSLWFVCEPDCPQDDCCLQKCHIECAYNGGYLGVSNVGPFLPRDASYWCISCGKITDILGCWKKQLSIAKDAPSVDVLCSRISLSHKLLDNTQRYNALHLIVTDVKSKLEAELGPIDRVSSRVGWGIVSRLCVARDVQKLCADAIEMASTSNWAPDPRGRGGELPPSCRILVEAVSSSSFVIDLICSRATLIDSVKWFGLWFWRYRLECFQEEPNLSFPASNRQVTLSNLHPSSEYAIRILSFTQAGALGASEVKFSTKDAGIIHMNPDPPGTVGSGDKSPCPGRNSHDIRVSSERTREIDVPIISVHPEPTGREEGLPSAGREQDCGPSERTPEANGSPSGMDVTTLSVDPEQTGHAEVFPNAGIEQDCGPSERATEFQAGDCSHSGPPTHLDLNAVPLPDLNQYINQDPTPPYEPSQAPPSEPSPPSELSQAPPSEPSQAEDSICPLAGVGSGGVEASRGIQKNAPPKMGPPRISSSPNEGNGSSVKTTAQRYEECVQTIRGLEREGHVSHAFRLKFLSWFSFKSTEQERRVVDSYIQALSDDRQCLGEQLVDSFSDIVFNQAQK